MSDFKWDDFDKVESNTGSDFNWDQFEKEKEDISKLESLGRGAAQGASFGFADELTGAGEALATTAPSGNYLEDLLTNYKKARDESRAAYKAAEQANPKSYMAGDIAGGVGTGLLTGGAGAVGSIGKVAGKESLKQLAKLGAKQGAIQGLGLSEADLTEGELGQAAKDTAIGAGVGGVAGAIVPMAAKGAGKLVSEATDYLTDKSPMLLEKGKAAYDLGKKGVGVVGKEAREKLTSDTDDIATRLIKSFRDQYSEGSEKVGQALGSKSTGIDFTNQLKNIEETLKKSNLTADDLSRVTREFDAFKEITEKETIEPGLEKAMAKMENMIAKAKSASSELGEDVSFGPIKNVDNKFLQSLKTQTFGDELIDSNKVAQTGTGLEAAKQKMSQKIASQKLQAQQLGENLNITEPIFDKESNMLISTVTSTNPKGEQVARVITQPVPKDSMVNVPVFGDKNLANVLQVDIPEDKVIKETVEQFKSLGLQDLNNIKARLNSTMQGDLDPLTKSRLSSMVKEIDNLIVGSMDQGNEQLYRAGNKEIADVYSAGDIFSELSPKNRFEKDLDLDLAKKLKSSSKGPELERAMQYGNLDSETRQQAKDVALRNELTRDVVGEGGFFGGLINPRGMAIRVGEGLGQASKTVEPVANFTKKLIDADDTMLSSFAQKLKASGNPYGDVLEKALTESTKRDRLLWSLSQQPAFRNQFNKEMGNTKEDEK